MITGAAQMDGAILSLAHPTDLWLRPESTYCLPVRWAFLILSVSSTRLTKVDDEELLELVEI